MITLVAAEVTSRLLKSSDDGSRSPHRGCPGQGRITLMPPQNKVLSLVNHTSDHDVTSTLYEV